MGPTGGQIDENVQYYGNGWEMRRGNSACMECDEMTDKAAVGRTKTVYRTCMMATLDKAECWLTKG